MSSSDMDQVNSSLKGRRSLICQNYDILILILIVILILILEVPDMPEGFESGVYKSGESWDSKFSTIASTYEECRAECTGIIPNLEILNGRSAGLNVPVSIFVLNTTSLR